MNFAVLGDSLKQIKSAFLSTLVDGTIKVATKMGTGRKDNSIAL